ncbi:DNA helicase [Brevibacterium sp. CCUG 69071]|nr:DNA helicase [Brevibacterium sp. CCUG 69071]
MTRLELSLGARVSSVDFVLHSPTPETSSRFTRTRSRFPTATTINRRHFSVDLEDLFYGLERLADWSDDQVHWDQELLDLLQGNFGDVTESADLGTSKGRLADGISEARRPGSPWSSDLRPFQLRDLTGLLTLSHGANFSVPGAGKTRVTLAYFEARRQSGKIEQMVVVCPKSAFEAWKSESIESFQPGSIPSIGLVAGKTIPETDIVLVNYERLADLVGALARHLRQKPTLLVLDEAHRMKLGASGTWGRACYTLAPYAKGRLILTGTPAPNGPEDLSNLFGFVWPGMGRRRVEGALSGSSLQEASQSLAPFYVRTTKNDLHLPTANIEPRRVKFEGIHRQVYEALIQLSRARTAGNADPAVLNMTSSRLLMAADSPALLSLGPSRYDPLEFKFESQQFAIDGALDSLLRDLPSLEFPPKYREALAILNENRDAGRKTIVWSTFVRNLTSLHALLDEHGLNPTIVHGGTKDREDQLAKFRNDPTSWVLLSNPATLGEGVSLHQVCHEAIYLDRDYNAGRYLQSLDRIHRLGLASDIQTRMVLLIAEDTVDEVVHERLETKVRFQLDILNDPYVEQLVDVDDVPAQSEGMNRDDVAALLNHLKTYDRPA